MVVFMPGTRGPPRTRAYLAVSRWDIVPPYLNGGVGLLDDDRAGHLGVQRTEVLVAPGLAEAERVPVVGVDGRRSRELPVAAHDLVGDVIGVDPGDRGPDRDGGARREEAEVVDLD